MARRGVWFDGQWQHKRHFTDKQRAAYWKKKYLALVREVKGWA